MNSTVRDPVLCQIERNAVVFLGLLSHVYLEWDPPIKGSSGETTHFFGLNIHAAVVDNSDGHILALSRNSIHKDDNPIEHAEQHAIRAAVRELERKRPRDNKTTVEDYYRNKLFYAAGKEAADFVYTGCSIYTTLEPCPMCTATLCVCRMKQVNYILPDGVYGGSWSGKLNPPPAKGVGLKDVYYAKYDLQYSVLDLSSNNGKLIARAQSIYSDILSKAAELSAKGIPATLTFDYLHDELQGVFEYFETVDQNSFVGGGTDLELNLNTLVDFRKLLNVT